MSIPEIPVIYHHNGILVINKPAGLASQPTRDGSPNVFELLKEKYSYIGLHHRLDRPASGLLLLCTDKKWNRNISEAFQKHAIQRQYWIACFGNVPDQGSWTFPIHGKKAKTHFQTQQRKHGFSSLHVQLETGRKHQIRVHAQKSGFPILGDRRYGGSVARLCPRLALHAKRLIFVHPATQETCTLEAPIPSSLTYLLSR